MDSTSQIARISQISQVDQSSVGESQKNNISSSQGSSFYEHLMDSVKDVNSLQLSADRMSSEMASGKKEALHETMLALTQAELSFNLLVQVRNKALEAYQDVMKMPV